MVGLTSLSVLTALLSSTTFAAPFDAEITTPDLISREVVTKQGCLYNVAGAGLFTQHLKIDFTKQTKLPASLYASDYLLAADHDGTEPLLDQYYNSSHIVLKKGQPMQMIVPGGQTVAPIQGAELNTVAEDILYASVRTVAKASNVSGTCHGFFFYKSDTQETDIEIRTAYSSSLFFTNQKTSSRATETTTSTDAPCDMTTDFHEYRYDWVKGATRFYVDGELVAQFRKNVPSKPGALIWNNWANGGSWSGGPPGLDSVLEIRSVEAFYNRTSVKAQC